MYIEPYDRPVPYQQLSVVPAAPSLSPLMESWIEEASDLYPGGMFDTCYVLSVTSAYSSPSAVYHLSCAAYRYRHLRPSGETVQSSAMLIISSRPSTPFVVSSWVDTFADWM